jgi:hypothetical protein
VVRWQVGRPFIRQDIRRGSFGNVKGADRGHHPLIDGWNERCHAFVRPKPPMTFSTTDPAKDLVYATLDDLGPAQ